MAEELKQEERETLGDERVYECGYLVSPLIASEELSVVAAGVRAYIERAGGVVFAEGLPQSRPLAYGIRGKVGAGTQVFTQASFGWVRCELSCSAVPALREMLRTDARIIRALTIETVRELTTAPRPHFVRGDRAPVEKHQELTEADEREIEKGIEELLTVEKAS